MYLSVACKTERPHRGWASGYCSICLNNMVHIYWTSSLPHPESFKSQISPSLLSKWMRIISDKRQNPTSFSKRTNNPISSINLVENFLTPYFVTLSLIPKAQIQGKQRGARWNVTDGALTHEKRKRRRGHQYETKQILLVFNVYCGFFFFFFCHVISSSKLWVERNLNKKSWFKLSLHVDQQHDKNDPRSWVAAAQGIIQ